MSFGRTKLANSLSARLTLLYGVVLTLSVGAAFLIAYLFIRSTLQGVIDRDLISQHEATALILRKEGIGAVRRYTVVEAQAAGERKVFFRLLTPDGAVFSSSNMDFWREIVIRPEAIQEVLSASRRVLATERLPGRSFGVRVLYARLGSGVILQTGQTFQPGARLVSAFGRIALVTLVVLALPAGVIGWLMARKALSGIDVVTRTALKIAEGDLSLRVPTQRGAEEINRLAEAFNRMVGRIADLVAGIREMSDNIAHDLKSPITRIRGGAEIALTTAESVADYQEMAASTIDECDRLLETVNTLLMISRTEAGVAAGSHEPLDLAQLVADVCELFAPLAEDRGISLTRRTPGTCTVSGDSRLLQRAVANLVDNAIRYTPPGGAVFVAVASTGPGAVELGVEDTGPGVADKDRPQIFDRFYRASASRSETGAGLGLSLVRAAAEAHGGTAEVFSRPGEGATFWISLGRPKR